MYCYKCGKEIRDDSTFCKYCGAVQADADETSSNTSAENKQESKINAVSPNKKKTPIALWIGLAVLLIAIIVGCVFIFGQKNKTEEVSAFDPDTIEQLSKSVLKIECYDSSEELVCSGSGVCAFQSDVVITNHHVAFDDGVKSIKVISDDNQSCMVKSILADDEGRDITILQLEQETNVVPLTLGESANLKRGDKVLAIGSPLGLLNSASDGIISGFYEGEGYTDLQFTAPISSGSSGGALFNEKGEVIGITYASYVDGQNLNLAIPIDEVKTLWNNKTEEQIINLNEANSKVETVKFADLLKNIEKYNGKEVIIEGYFSSSWGDGDTQYFVSSFNERLFFTNGNSENMWIDLSVLKSIFKQFNVTNGGSTYTAESIYAEETRYAHNQSIFIASGINAKDIEFDNKYTLKGVVKESDRIFDWDTQERNPCCEFEIEEIIEHHPNSLDDPTQYYYSGAPVLHQNWQDNF